MRVIVVSTFSDDDLVDACITAGAKGYVIKDIERFDLKRSIRAVHRGEGVLAPSVAGKVLGRVRAQDRPSAPAGPPLNATQLAILRLISEGFTNPEIAARVHLSQNTVKSHVQEIFRTLGVPNRVERRSAPPRRAGSDPQPGDRHLHALPRHLIRSSPPSHRGWAGSRGAP